MATAHTVAVQQLASEEENQTELRAKLELQFEHALDSLKLEAQVRTDELEALWTEEKTSLIERYKNDEISAREFIFGRAILATQAKHGQAVRRYFDFERGERALSIFDKLVPGELVVSSTSGLRPLILVGGEIASPPSVTVGTNDEEGSIHLDIQNPDGTIIENIISLEELFNTGVGVDEIKALLRPMVAQASEDLMIHGEYADVSYLLLQLHSMTDRQPFGALRKLRSSFFKELTQASSIIQIPIPVLLNAKDISSEKFSAFVAEMVNRPRVPLQVTSDTLMNMLIMEREYNNEPKFTEVEHFTARHACNEHVLALRRQ